MRVCGTGERSATEQSGLGVSRGNADRGEREAKGWVQSGEAESQAPRNQEAANVFSCKAQRPAEAIPG